MAPNSDKKPDRHFSFKSLNVWFALSSLALLATTIWMVVADYAKPWKRLQAEFRDLERQQLIQEAEVEKQRINEEDLTQIRDDIAQEETRLDERRSEIQASEKVYQTFNLEVTNPGGHSSVPTRDNAIYHLAAALTRLSAYDFPVVLNEITSAYFDRMSKIASGNVARDMAAVVKDQSDKDAAAGLSRSPYYNALLRTTCVATQLQAGHAENALPQTASVTVNCRVLPGESIDGVEQTLRRVLDDPAIQLTRVGIARPSEPSPLTPELLATVERITEEMWNGVKVLPTMVTGATDGLYLRNAGIPTYGVSGIFLDLDDLRMHGKDERVGVKSFFDGQEFLYRLVKALAGPSS